MKTERAIRILAGTMVLVSLALTHWVHPMWVWFTVFIGLNLFQSGITGFCPPETLFRKLGISDEGGNCRR